MPKVNIFNGGLRTASASHLIKEHESPVNLNIDHISGILQPIKDKVLGVSGASKWGHYFTTDAEWYWSTVPKDWVEYQERLYIGNRTGFSTKIINGTEYLLGIVPPTTIPTGTVSEETPEDLSISRMHINSFYTDGATIPAGITVTYRAVNTTAAGTYYPSDTEFPFVITDNGWTPDTVPEYQENQTHITIADTNIDDRVSIFRFFDNAWRLVYTSPSGGGTLNGIDDAVYDISANDSIENYLATGLVGTYQYALTFFNTRDGTESVPVISKEIVVDYGTITVDNLEIPTDPQVDERRLYRIGGTLTAFSLVAKLDIAVTSYVDNVGDNDIPGNLLDSETNFPPVENLKYLMESYAMMFAADGDKLRFTPIGTPDYWPQTYYLNFPRPITGLARTPIGILVFNTFETWLITGTGPLALAQQLLTGSQGCINGDSVVNIEGTAYWASTDGICVSNGGQVEIVTRFKLDKLDLSASVNAVVHDEQYHILLAEQDEALILDIKRQVFRKSEYGIDSFITANDILYGYDSNSLYEIEKSTIDLPMVYLSPRYIGRGFTTPKVYKNIYVYSEGDITLTVYINGVLVQTRNLTTTDNHQIKIPDIHTRGFSIQFGISGTGAVYEIEWEDGNAAQ